MPLGSPQNPWASYVNKLVSHYRGKIDTWIFYNEPDVFSPPSDYRTFAGTAKDYAQLLQAGYLVAKAANPNAARVFINWFLSRRGQMIWQEVMNAKVLEPSNSMRIDIPKDNVPPEARREEGKRYRVTGILDPDPVAKLLNELLGRAK